MGDFTIQISSNLVKQLADDGVKIKKKTRKPKTKAPREQFPAKEQQKHNVDDSETLKSPNAMGWPVQPPLFMPITPPQLPAQAEIDAIRSVLQDSERVLERLQKHEDDMVKQVTQKAKDLHEKEFKIPQPKPMPCLVEKDACLECYKENVKDPLKCASLVEQFSNCARMARQQVSSAEK
ncbi:hypothetical protein ACET3Z_000502 [Daucus carota]